MGEILDCDTTVGELLEKDRDVDFDGFEVGFTGALVVGDTDDDDGEFEGALDSGALVDVKEGGDVVALTVVGNRDGDVEVRTNDLVGKADGNEVAELVGNCEGDFVVQIVGSLVGEDLVGENDGKEDKVGTIVGEQEGIAVGLIDGDTVGPTLGDDVGLIDGDTVDPTLGDDVGLIDGDTVGQKLGDDFGTAADGIAVEEIDLDGEIVGKIDGEVVGEIVVGKQVGNFEDLVGNIEGTFVGALAIIPILTPAIAFILLTGGGMLFEK